MLWPRWAVIVLAIASGIYLSGFVFSHNETLGANAALNWLFLWSPLAIVIAAARLWPRWWLVPAVFAFFFVIPVGVDEFERRTGIYPVGTYEATYEMSGMDNLTTSFLAIYAFPMTIVAVIAVFFMRQIEWRRPGAAT